MDRQISCVSRSSRVEFACLSPKLVGTKEIHGVVEEDWLTGVDKIETFSEGLIFVNQWTI